MHDEQCISCATLGGHHQPPGGIVYEDGYWVFFLRSRPLLVPGQGFIVLKRHCEHLDELTESELAALGPMMRKSQVALDRVLQPAKVHFGLYAEDVKHIHLHVIPRLSTMPKGNIRMTFLHRWYEFLAYLHLKQPYPDTAVAEVAIQLHQAFHAEA
ncbi:MAG: HIT family protein [Nostocaceae cyanobacterium]|nr:HIT family protein [Nostocaceae cyanobacterium]